MTEVVMAYAISVVEKAQVRGGGCYSVGNTNSNCWTCEVGL